MANGSLVFPVLIQKFVFELKGSAVVSNLVWFVANFCDQQGFLMVSISACLLGFCCCLSNMIFNEIILSSDAKFDPGFY